MITDYKRRQTQGFASEALSLTEKCQLIGPFKRRGFLHTLFKKDHREAEVLVRMWQTWNVGALPWGITVVPELWKTAWWFLKKLNLARIIV